MAVVTVREIWDRDGSHQFPSGERRYTRTFRVRTNDDNTAILTVGSATGLPRLFDFYADPDGNFDLASRCISVSPSQDQNDPRTWLVRCEYASNFLTNETQSGINASGVQAPVSGGVNIQPANPLERSVEVSGGTRYIERYLEYDAAGTDYLNSAGDKLENVGPRLYPIFVIQCASYKAELDLFFLGDYAKSVNSSLFMGFPADTVLLDDIQYQSMIELGIFYWKITYTFLFNQEKWIPTRRLDIGPNFLSFATGVYKKHKYTAKGYPIMGLLNGTTGEKSDTPVYLEFQDYHRRDHNALGIFGG